MIRTAAGMALVAAASALLAIAERVGPRDVADSDAYAAGWADALGSLTTIPADPRQN